MSETTPLSEMLQAIKVMAPDERAEFEKVVIEGTGDKPFIPNAGAQTMGLNSEADILLFGGRAGGGKTAVEVGAWFNEHYHGVIFRREGTQTDDIIRFCKEIGEPDLGRYVGGSESVFRRHDGGTLKITGMPQADDWRKHAGNARDLICFDEAAEFLKDQVFSMLGWLRSARQGQRCRMILGSNPPRGGDGEWVMEEFAPWLDDAYADHAEPGELRWAIVINSVTEWVDGPGEYDRDGEIYEALSRTFIPASLAENPFLAESGYRAKINSMPEPLRSQLLYGDFHAGREDHEWQIIPTDWVDAAMDRWEEPVGKFMLALGVDCSGGGGDAFTAAPLYQGNIFGQVATASDDIDTRNGTDTGSWVGKQMRNDCVVGIDAGGGYGNATITHMKDHMGIKPVALVGSSGSNRMTLDKNLGFFNLRAEQWWDIRNGLDPASDEPIALPPDKRLKAELTTPRYEVRKGLILVEDKKQIRKRLNRSTDSADAVINAWHIRKKGQKRLAEGGGSRRRSQSRNVNMSGFTSRSKKRWPGRK